MPRTLDYPIVNLNPRQSAPYDHNACPSQTDRWTNIMTIARRFVLRRHRVLKNQASTRLSSQVQLVVVGNTFCHICQSFWTRDKTTESLLISRWREEQNVDPSASTEHRCTSVCRRSRREPNTVSLPYISPVRLWTTTASNPIHGGYSWRLQWKSGRSRKIGRRNFSRTCIFSLHFLHCRLNWGVIFCGWAGCLGIESTGLCESTVNWACNVVL